MRAPASTPRLLSAAATVMGLGVAFEASHALFGLGGHSLDGFAGKWVYTGVELIAVLVCATRVLMRREDRWAWGFMTLGLLAWTGGDLVWAVWLDNLADPPTPSVADGLYLVMYPAMYVALMLLIRSRLRHVGVAQWLDGGVVGLTVAAIGAGLILPAVLALNTGQLIVDAVNLAYPLGDFALLIFVIVALSLSGWRPGRLWLLLGAGIAASAVADLVYVYLVAKGTYGSGGILDTTWPVSMALFALAAWQPATRHAADRLAVRHTILLSLVSAGIALGLLVDAAFQRVTPVAVLLAAGALLLATARAGLTYLENVKMLRRTERDAVTDGLSGLGNRRKLMQDLEAAIGSVDGLHPATLVFFDLNGFKRYNDSFGHAAGDALLARVGAALQLVVETSGSAYRLGGDEFCVLADGRFARQDRLLALASAALTETGTAFTVNASFGVAVMPDDARSATAALQLADERMYADKARSNRTSRAQTRDVLLQLLDEATPELHDHVSGVGQLAIGVGRQFSLDSDRLDELLRAAELHDIGKLAIPDEILNKPGPLSESEWRFMHQHPIIGERILNAAPALQPVARLVRASHERWDGSGYPDGIAGEAIPLGARIIAACDAYHVMISDRCYQGARSTPEALAELTRGAGSQFDPVVIEALRIQLEPTLSTDADPTSVTGHQTTISPGDAPVPLATR